jgi:hypothetical protein
MQTDDDKQGKRDPEIMAQVREQAERLARLEALGQRALACKGWRWMPGMLGLSNQSSSRSIWIRIVDPPMDDASECWPDFSDPATLGCLLALVREAWNDPTLGLFAVRGGRSGRPARVWAFGGRRPRRKGFDASIASAFFGSEAAALVFGLEAAQ